MAEHEPGLVAQFFGRVAYEFTLVQPLIPTYIHLLVSAALPIYAGAHASLTRPSSAAKPDKRLKKAKSKRHGDSRSSSESESEDEEQEEESKMEGLAPSDALIMPLLAGSTLAGLYFLIKWLDDPTILNKALNAYFALFGVFSVARLVADALDLGHSLLFPTRYARGGVLWHVKQRKRLAIPAEARGGDIKFDPNSSPLPGLLSRIPLSEGVRDLLWNDRAMPRNKWAIKLYLHRIFAGTLRIGAHGIAGSIIAVAAVAYFNLVDKPWYLTNLMGFGFSYGALQLMSPTTFATGSLILSALFFYDIYFVFYTPMMVTVAKSLDVPIKLLFPRPPLADGRVASHAMLGLGDIVLPGIMIGLALRFDHYLFYLRRQTMQKVDQNNDGSNDVKEDNIRPVITHKSRYWSTADKWGDYFWSHDFFGRPLYPANHAHALDSGISGALSAEAPFTFPRPYFSAAMTGYLIGMLATLGVMQVWGHAQPALLYLVPGVLGSLWLTALFRGEIKLMWNFTEEVTEEEDEHKGEKEDKHSESSPTEDGKAKTKTDNVSSPAAPKRTSFFSLSDKADRYDIRQQGGKHIRTGDDHSDDSCHSSESGSAPGSPKKVRRIAHHRSSGEVFSLSIEAPWNLKFPRSVMRPKRGHSCEKESGDDERKREQKAKQKARKAAKARGSQTPTSQTKETGKEQPAKRVRVN